MEEMSFGHSMNVRRRFLPLTTVMGPRTSVSVCFVYFLINDYSSAPLRTPTLIRVVFPTFGGPITTITIGGFVPAERLGRGACTFLKPRSRLRWIVRLVLMAELTEKAYSPQPSTTPGCVLFG